MYKPKIPIFNECYSYIKELQFCPCCNIKLHESGFQYKVNFHTNVDIKSSCIFSFDESSFIIYTNCSMSSYHSFQFFTDFFSIKQQTFKIPYKLDFIENLINKIKNNTIDEYVNNIKMLL